MSNYRQKFKNAFLCEATGYIEEINLALVELEKDPTQLNYLQTIFRNVHTLKSLSGTMNYTQTMRLCDELEMLLASIKNEKIPLVPCVGLLFECLSYLSVNLNNISNNESELDAGPLIQKVKQLSFSTL